MTEIQQLLAKYNGEIPRYTSYPTVPFWKDLDEPQIHFDHFRRTFPEQNKKEGVAVYMHLPFCETLCTYCGCNKVITTNHSVETPYLNAILEEWHLYRNLMESRPVIRELHLGGGTPTYFSPLNLRKLLVELFKISEIHAQPEFSIEGHPNNTTKAHLDLLYSFGFRRISYGVQDHDPEVQRIINRIQPYENVKRATEQAREAGFNSINFDLIYGLPRQTETTIEKTIRDTIALRPDRIAFYSYAHVPWKAKSQRLYDENDLPAPEQKLKFYAIGRQLLLEAGYKDIGMDHYALPEDDLYKACQNGTLHRNFMGYTTAQTNFLIGLGVSAISDTNGAYVQNNKKLTEYYRGIEAGQIPLQRGYLLNEEDIAFKTYILDIACKGETTLQSQHEPLLREMVIPELREMEKDGLVELTDSTLRLSRLGHLLLRNVCHAFDLKAKTALEKTSGPKFSAAV